MTKNIKFFFIGFVFSLPFFWGTNVFQKNLEDFLFWGKIADNPQLLTAQIIQEDKLEQLKPIRNWQVANLEISAKSAISVFLDPQGDQKVLFSKESDRALPIASLTKLMTANVILENYDPFQPIKISKQAVAQEEDTGHFKVGEIFFTEGLLHSSLMESSNDATAALTELIGEKAFVDLMNLTAEDLELENTYFIDAIGLDPDTPDGPINHSTAEDLAKLTIYLLEIKPKIIGILSLPEYNLYSTEGVFHHKIKNTNELLQEIPGIVAGKTGWTPEAEGCLLIIFKFPENKGEIINVILGSSDRFKEMKKLVEWLKEAYKW